MTRPKGWPIAVRTVEVREPLRRIDDVGGYSRTRVFVHDGGRLIGSVDIGNARGPILSLACETPSRATSQTR
jgi:hypothetical protein